uniref:Glycoprotein M n=1 Tax=Anatid alphaherpesvirus 2 TaxID=3080522 RepID=A0AAU0K6N0_9ALPH
MVCFAISVVLFLTTLIVASINGAGFPCFFAAVADYTKLNESARDTGLTSPRLGGIVPVLFFEAWEVAFFFYATAVILLIVACYLMAAGSMVMTNMRSSADSGGAAYVVSLVAPPSTLLTGTISVWLLQAVVVVLAHRLIVLAAAVYIVHFVTFTFFYGYFVGRGVDSRTYADDVAITKQVDSSVHRLVGNARAFMTNLLSAVYGASLIMLALMFEMLLANNFTIKFWHVLVITLSTTSVLTVIYLMVTELLIARYVHMILGGFVGLLVGYGMLGTSAHDYMNKFYYAMGKHVEGLRLASQIVLGVFAFIVLVCMIVRIVRASIYHRRRFTRAYTRTRKIKGEVRDKIRRLSGRDKRRDGGGDRLPLREVNYTSGTSDEEKIYDVADLTDDSEWED